MGKEIDKVGMVFGSLTVLERMPKQEHHAFWRCKCVCGKECVIRGDKLVQSKVMGNGSPSCGCMRGKNVAEATTKNILGERFGRLTVIEKTGKRADASVIWKCRCDCGNIVEVSSHSLIRGATRSCGCYQKDRAKEIGHSRQVIPEIGSEVKGFLIEDVKINDVDNKVYVYAKCPYCENRKWIKLHYIWYEDIKSCGCISSSAGEKKIEKILLLYKISFVKQKTFEDLKDKKALRFDFYLPDYNLCIEYDGSQHYYPTTFGHKTKEEGLKNLEDIQRRDSIKNQYCINNNIKLIRIPYTYYDKLTIEDLLPETSDFIINS